jgi:hypothetical protein
MNRRQLEQMQGAILRLDPPPLLVGDTGTQKEMDVLWRVTSVTPGRKGQLEVTTLSQAFRLALYFDCVREYRQEDLRHPSFKQGMLLLKAQWIIRPEGQPPLRKPLRSVIR